MAQRRDITFQSHGETLAAWIWRVDGSKSGGRGKSSGRGPAIVLGHGLGAVKEMGLNNYGDVFSQAGYHVLAFDYRFFGGSTGIPRQLLDIEKQQEDWHAALAFIRSQDSVDPDRVAIFGSSFGGGHVIRVAATDTRVAAAIAQCPFTSGIRSALTLGPIAGLGVGLKAARDMVTGNSMIKLAGKPGEAALMNAPDVIPGYLGLVPDSLDFKNEVLARIGLKILFACAYVQ